MLSGDPSIQSAIELIHRGDEAQRRAACDLLYRHWHRQIAAFVLSRCPGLTRDRVVNAVNDAFLSLVSASANLDYDPISPERLLFTVALRRGFDELRSQTKCGKWRPLHSDMTTSLIETGQYGSEVPTSADHAENAEMWEAIRAAIAVMPERQRHVAQLMVDHCNGPVTARVIQDLARITDGMYLTLPAANRALEEVKKKLREVLVRFGRTPE
jgi:DNA-directed RNA polymerase specialized sigma24 family protein